jgi:hypothetical protein
MRQLRNGDTTQMGECPRHDSILRHEDTGPADQDWSREERQNRKCERLGSNETSIAVVATQRISASVREASEGKEILYRWLVLLEVSCGKLPRSGTRLSRRRPARRNCGELVGDLRHLSQQAKKSEDGQRR